jgi:hypothetical protein
LLKGRFAPAHLLASAMPEWIYALLTFTFQADRKYWPRHCCRDDENKRQILPLRGIICRVRAVDFAGLHLSVRIKKERLGWFRPLRPKFPKGFIPFSP